MRWKREPQLRKGHAWTQVFKQFALFACSFIVLHILISTLNSYLNLNIGHFLIHICFGHKAACNYIN